ncbi:MAG: epoxyqueuosine reductase QueH, partial [Firmicutes bacterium]|nr:epoxyqueuosine reductase QueH [Bacillota bacterium]
MEQLFLHVCCAPCSTYSLKAFLEKGFQPTGFFFNPNIHPYKEFEKRAEAVEQYYNRLKVPLLMETDYLLEKFLNSVPFNRPERCLACCRWRLQYTAEVARQN